MNQENYKKYQVFLFPVMILLSVVVLFYFFTLPKIRETRLLYEENKTLLTKAAALETKAKKLKDIKGSTMMAEFEKMEKILPSEKNITYLISSLTKLESDNGVNYNAITLNPGTIKETEKIVPKKITAAIAAEEKSENTATPQPASESNYQPLKLNLSFSVKPENAFDFVDKLYLATPVYIVTNSIYSKADNTGTLALEIETYYMSLPKVLGSLETPLPELNENDKKIISGLNNFNIIDEKPVDYVVVSSASGAIKITNNIFKM